MGIRDDINRKREHEISEVYEKIHQCGVDYKDNNCDPRLRVKALEEYCQ